MQILSKFQEGTTRAPKNLPSSPGIYQFIGKDKLPIYIGKAKNIRKRVGSYFRNSDKKSKKIDHLVKEASYLEIIITNTELEALLLEQRLIKEKKPKYNVQFKDDKGYPWIRIEVSKKFPGAKSFLGTKDQKEIYFGPYPNFYSVKQTLNLIHKTFKLRSCTESFFKNRTRPCLQYEIGRCSGPCVGLISVKDYTEEVKATSLLLEGRSEEIISNFYSKMDAYSKKMSYEKAAIYRDKISALRDIQRNQSIAGFSKERDAIVASSFGGITKVGVTHVHNGWIPGHENFIQKTKGIEESVVNSFIKSHYFSNNFCPKTLVLEDYLEDKREIETALSLFHKKKIKIITRPAKKDKGLLEISLSNTRFSLERLSKETKDISHLLISLQEQLKLKNKINLIESYDISHHSGTGAVGGCVAYSKLGRNKEHYRLYDIADVNAGNDIASMEEVIRRRFSHKSILLKPDLILIDGGRIHLKHIKDLLCKLSISDIEILAISKGARRKADMDSIHAADGSVTRIIKGSKTHLFLQEIRDETHRFSISTQKKKQVKLSMQSNLDDIKGLGVNKKKLLLRYFGSLEQVKKANIQDLMNVSGIGKKIATLIYNHLH